MIRCIHRILDVLVSEKIYGTYVKLPTRNTQLHESISTDNDFYPYFSNCIGAIDGTHLPAFVPGDKCAPYRNRKGVITQNVLAACSFDFRFIYILSGWEGSASDSLVYQDARATDFQIPEEKYYLADAGYPNTDNLLVPYWGMRYHLKEWGQSRDRCDCVISYLVFASSVTGLAIFKSYLIFDMHDSGT
jgi:DDE superfamily endonuclease